MSGSTRSFETKGASYDPTATPDLSPVSESEEVLKSSGSEKKGTASGHPKKKVKKETKKKKTKEVKKKAKSDKG